MLFRKKIDWACAYCIHSAKIDEEMFLCAKKGIKMPDDSCRKFQYDPLKRIPNKAKPLDFSKYETEDFSL